MKFGRKIKELYKKPPKSRISVEKLLNVMKLGNKVTKR